MKTTRLIWLCVLLGGCGGASHRQADESTGCAVDEQYNVFEDGEAHVIVDDTNAPQMTQPLNGATVPSSPKVIVQWNQKVNNPGAPDGDVAHVDGVNGCNMCCEQFNIGALKTLHEPPESGDIYDLHFTVGGSYVWRVITTLQEWTPPDDLWARWKGQKVSIQIYRMAILLNDPKEGPYTASQPYTFTVGP
jgi:hypothetical protein